MAHGLYVRNQSEWTHRGRRKAGSLSDGQLDKLKAKQFFFVRLMFVFRFLVPRQELHSPDSPVSRPEMSVLWKQIWPWTNPTFFSSLILFSRFWILMVSCRLEEIPAVRGSAWSHHAEATVSFRSFAKLRIASHSSTLELIRIRAGLAQPSSFPDHRGAAQVSGLLDGTSVGSPPSSKSFESDKRHLCICNFMYIYITKASREAG